MELFRINGLSSEDLMRPGHNPTKAFLGSMFKIGDQTVPPPAPGSELADEEGAEASLEKSGALPKDDDERWSEKDLKALNKDKLVELGAHLGVADLSGTKDKLVEAILAAQ